MELFLSLSLSYSIENNTTCNYQQLLFVNVKVKRLFDRLFPEELSTWLQQEIRLNKKKPISRSQREFWSAPLVEGGSDQPLHDPRGCPSYVTEYVENYPEKLRNAGSGNRALRIHRPHPNIVEDLSSEGRRRLPVASSTTTSSSSRGAVRANGNAPPSDDDDDSGASDLDDIELDEKLQISSSNTASVQL